ncbi:MAG: orotidine-5'-phosphate decarboxylase [Gammaproteobacteria bacterium]
MPPTATDNLQHSDAQSADSSQPQNTLLNWPDYLAKCVARQGHPAVLGLDPHADRIDALKLPDANPEQILYDWAIDILHQLDGLFDIVKIQQAWFELWGSQGFRALERITAELRRNNIAVIADVKRTDIGPTARAYAQAWLQGAAKRADAITTTPWLGAEGLDPFVEVCNASGSGMFICSRTSNSGSEQLQNAAVASQDGAEPAWRYTWKLAAAYNRRLHCPAVGLVVGANRVEEACYIREHDNSMWLLAPGLGAQKADASQARYFINDRGLGALFPSSRAITFPPQGSVRDAALRFISCLPR